MPIEPGSQPIKLKQSGTKILNITQCQCRRACLNYNFIKVIHFEKLPLLLNT
uniref:Uncharacterized protein n=1 Tax=Anguilla anguilla TaxID=7936 RepID=A0A0E9WTF6_ANGAN